MSKKYLIQELVDVPKKTKLLNSDLLYHGSLVPNKKILKEVHEIDFIVSLRHPLKKKPIEHHNQVNTHLFKPKYYLSSKEHKLNCYVASKDVLFHTIRSLALMSKHEGNSKIRIKEINARDQYHDYSKKWQIHDRILVSRVESTLNFLRLIWLLENSSLSSMDIKNLAIDLELSRINNSSKYKLNYLEKKYLENHKLTFSYLDKTLNVEVKTTESPYIKLLNFKYKNTEISAVQLPWGGNLSAQLINSIQKINNHISKIGIVGGVGYVGENNDVRVDDVFIPEKIIEFSNGIYKSRALNNHIVSQEKNKYFNSKREFKGSIKTIVPELGKVSYTRPILNKLSGKLDSVDMEKEMMIKNLNSKRISIGSMYYIMDIPSRKIGLGDTYYKLSFLENLFKTYERGKYYCFEKVLNFLSI